MTKWKQRTLVADLAIGPKQQLNAGDDSTRSGRPEGITNGWYHRQPELKTTQMSSKRDFDAGNKLADALKKIGKWTLEIVRQSGPAKCFELLPRRWVVERTLACLEMDRRLAKDFERSIQSAEAWALIASIRIITRKIATYHL